MNCFALRTKSGNGNGIRRRRSKAGTRCGNNWSLRGIWKSEQPIPVIAFVNTCEKSAAQSKNNEIARIRRSCSRVDDSGAILNARKTYNPYI